MGPENPRQKTHYAGLFAPPGAALVPQGLRTSEAAERRLALPSRMLNFIFHGSRHASSCTKCGQALNGNIPQTVCPKDGGVL